MDDLENDTQDDLDESSDSTDVTPPAVTLESLQAEIAASKAEIAALRSADTRRQTDLVSAVGRLQSLQAKVDAGNGDAATLAELDTRLGAAHDMLDALLEDEAVDPKVREKAKAVRSKATKDSEIADLRREVEALKAPKATAPQPDNGPTPFETGVITAIEAAGLDPDDAIFDWRGEASALLNGQGPAAARDYFKRKIAEALELKAVAGRRQSRKTAAGDTGTPAGAAGNPLDPSRPKDEQLAYLRSIGAI
jgi:hypothetical protein